MNALTQLVDRIAYPFLRIAMGIVLVWIGGLKFVDPSPVCPQLIKINPIPNTTTNCAAFICLMAVPCSSLLETTSKFICFFMATSLGLEIREFSERKIR